MNGARNVEFARRAPSGGSISIPVLILHAEYDYVCETSASRLAGPMRRDRRDLTEVVVASGDWMAQEKPGGERRAGPVAGCQVPVPQGRLIGAGCQ
jgi:hypothetical protein